MSRDEKVEVAMLLVVWLALTGLFLLALKPWNLHLKPAEVGVRHWQ